MKTAKMVIGIISMVLFIFVALQSCAAGIGNAMSANGQVSGSAGFILAIFMLIAGIIGVVTRTSKGGGITAGVFYALAGIIGICNFGSYKDLAVWSVLSFIFAAVFIAGSVRMPKKVKEEKESSKKQ